MQENQTRNGLVIILAAAMVTALLGLGRIGDSGQTDGRIVPEWVLLAPEGVMLSPQVDHDWISRSRTAAFDLDGFRGQLLEAAEPDRSVFELPLFEDVSFIAQTRTIERRHDDRFTWVAELAGIEGGHVIVSVYGDAAYGMVNAPGRGLFEFHPAPEGEVNAADAHGLYVLNEIDADRLPGCGVGPEHCVNLPERQPRRGIIGHARRAIDPQHLDGDWDVGDGEAATSETPILRVMVAYTPAARNVVGGQSAMLAFVDSTIAQTNLAFENSMIDMQAELAIAHEVTYAESDNITTDLFRITDVDNGYMDEVHELRALHQADLVALLVTYSGGACGVAWCMSTPTLDFAPFTFSVTRTQCVPNLTFQHELGHNMGCHHDHQNSGGSCGTYGYSFGHRFFDNTGVQRRTILAYSPGQRILHFSNPEVLYLGQPTGVPVGAPGQAHNAQSINLNAPIVTNFATEFPPPLPPENNNCEDRIIVSDGTADFANLFATTEGPNEQLCTIFGNSQVSNDVWYEYTATCTGEMTVDLCSSAITTKLGIYTGSSCPTEPDTADACDVASCPSNRSIVTMPVDEGETFIIRIGSRVDATGNGVMTITCEEVDPGIPGDLNDDGVVDGDDLLILLSQWGECLECDDCPADLDNDCTVDGADLLILLANWG